MNTWQAPQQTEAHSHQSCKAPPKFNKSQQQGLKLIQNMPLMSGELP